MVITGGSSGIGEIAAERLAQMCARIVLIARILFSGDAKATIRERISSGFAPSAPSFSGTSGSRGHIITGSRAASTNGLYEPTGSASLLVRKHLFRRYLHIRGRLRGAPADHRKGLAHLRGSRDSRAHGDTESETCRFPADHAKPDRSGALFDASRNRAATPCSCHCSRSQKASAFLA